MGNTNNKIGGITEDTYLAPPILMGLMKMFVDSKLCYHSDPMKTAKYIDQHIRVAYQIDLWTLIDKRKFKRCEKPYENEPAPNKSRRGLFDYQYKLKYTILKKSIKEDYDLEETQRKIACPRCDGEGEHKCPSCNGRRTTTCWSCIGKGFTGAGATMAPCTSCSGRGNYNCSKCRATGKVNCERCETRRFLLCWWRLRIKWSNVHTVSYQTNTPFTPRKIRKAPTKQIYNLPHDEEWSYVDTFHGQFEEYFAQQPDTDNPVKLDEVAKDFNKKHFKKTKKNRRIVRMKWNIQKLKIFEVVYQLDDYTNKQMKDLSHRFRFYYYGQGKKNRPLIFDNEYPLNTCGCFGVGCAHHSVCCTIS